uniref:At1g04390 ARM repeat domain-containing protein n=1 Tax=Glycine max TaxID=3847 RepID=A0A0R0GYR8_SOYBN
MKSDRGKEKEKENDSCISSHMQTLHRRLLHALNLGTRSQLAPPIPPSHFPPGTCCRYFGSALLWIFQCKSEALLSMASDVAVKVISFIPNSLLQFHMLDLVYCLSSLLSSHQVEVATPCAIALNLVISNLSATSEKAVMEALKETETSMRIVGNRKDFAEGAKKIEYFEETTLLLSTILWRWPPSRFPVGNDVILMKVLANIHTRTDSSIKLTLLKLYTSLYILWWLTIHCGENLNPRTHGSELCINLLITCAFLSFVDTLEKWCRICQKDIADPFQGEPVSRAVLVMIHSPRNSISSHARFLLLDVLNAKGLSGLKSLI